MSTKLNEPSQTKTVRIWFEKLVTTRGGTELPLSELKRGDHLHGGLRLELGGRLVPNLGYFGPDDVCINTWLGELDAVARVFNASKSGKYVFDEGEQGQPAFVFERANNAAYFRIVEGIGGGTADPDWQRVEFSPDDFLTEHQRFREAFLAAIRTAAPKGALKWIAQNAKSFQTDAINVQ
jgi:hypothetical protein